MRWNSGSFGHDFTYVRIHSPVRMCGSLRDVRKKACFLVRDKTQCAQIYCKNDVADYKKEIHGYKKWELFSILFIIPYLCRVFHADTSVRGVWESGKYIYIEKTFTWRFVLGTLKLRKFLTLPQTKQQQVSARYVNVLVSSLLVKEVFKLYISAWASALLVRTGWAMRRPQSAG